MKIFGAKTLLTGLLSVLLLTAIFSSKGALQDVHWDAPIYLHRARTYADTPYLQDLSAGARQIVNELRHFKAGPGNSTPYWSFIRLGNTILLGSLTALLGPEASTIRAAFWIYTALLMAALVMAVQLSLRLTELLVLPIGRTAALAGALVSGGLYAASDVCRYLAGNFVAEVPALFLMAASALSLVRANALRSLPLAVLSGAMAFALYVVKMDAVWVYLSFLFLLLVSTAGASTFRLWWPASVGAAVTAAILYGAFALWFWPMADPRLIVVFQRAHEELAVNQVSPIKLWIVAGGLLWPGLALAFRYAGRERALWFAVAWIALVFLPYAPAVIYDRPMQVRVFALLLLPLLIASVIGWGAFIDELTRRRVHHSMLWILGPLLMTGIALSHAESYALIRQLPGAWRLQYVKEWLSPPRYERLSYPLTELERITSFIYEDPATKVIVIDRPKNEELFSIIQYLRPADTAAQSRSPIAQGKVVCGREQDVSSERIVLCLTPPDAETVHQLGRETRVLYLHRLDNGAETNSNLPSQIVFRAGSLVLVASPPLGRSGV